jgi:hypothetical protein
MLVAACSLAVGAAPLEAEVLELHGEITEEHEVGDAYLPGQAVTVRVSVDRQVPYKTINDFLVFRSYTFDAADDGEITITFDGSTIPAITLPLTVIWTPDEPTGDDQIQIRGEGGGLNVVVSLSTHHTADEHPFPLELHDYDLARVVLAQDGFSDFVFIADIDWAQPVREDLLLLEEARDAIEGLHDSLAGVPSLLADLASTKASQTSVDNLMFVLQALEAQVGSMGASVLGILNGHGDALALIRADLESLRAGVSQALANDVAILANQGTILANQAALDAKVELLIERLVKKP